MSKALTVNGDVIETGKRYRTRSKGVILVTGVSLRQENAIGMLSSHDRIWFTHNNDTTSTALWYFNGRYSRPEYDHDWDIISLEVEAIIVPKNIRRGLRLLSTIEKGLTNA